MKLTRLGAAIVAASLVVAACGGTSSGAKTLKIGISLPLSGSSLASAGPARDGALLAIKEANAAGTIKGYTLAPYVLDHAVNGQYDTQQGAKDMTTFVSDSAVMAVVGPFNSAVAKVQIPISNEAGLLQCSPANTNPDLTKGDGGKQLRAANPDKINYVRVATTDDIQGPAVAQFGVQDLGLKNIVIIDDQSVYGKGLADQFAAEWTKLGGTVVDRQGADPKTTDFLPILTKFASESPDSLFFGGVTANGGGLIRKQMPQAGLGDIPLLGGDGIQDQNGGVAGSYINIAGAAAANSYSSVAAIHDIPDAAAFKDKFTAEYKTDPGAYAASGYACAQVIIKAIETAASKGDVTREAVRAAGSDPNTTFDTVLGPIKFDAVGDTNQKIISLYKVDMALADGKGDWAFVKQINYGQ
ncbi:MAG: branched-chain amino acid ABC transporter substrate-binding protein [Chloroflexi bacterium]|nr:branched-chain amino acid ABC transporter substrate-binding protein [Chloroflexota bacterium]